MALAAALLVAPVPGPASMQAGEESDRQFRSSLSVVLHDPALRVLLGAQGFYQVLTGATDFLMVILALSILHIGQGGAGLSHRCPRSRGLAGRVRHGRSDRSIKVGRHHHFRVFSPQTWLWADSASTHRPCWLSLCSAGSAFSEDSST